MKATLNRCVFRRDLKFSRDDAILISAGNLFHKVGVATLNATGRWTVRCIVIMGTHQKLVLGSVKTSHGNPIVNTSDLDKDIFSSPVFVTYLTVWYNEIRMLSVTIT